MTTILQLADDYAKAYFMGRGEEPRKLLQSAVMRLETEAHNAVLIEREACAMVAQETSTCLLPTGSFLSERCAAAIRARNQLKEKHADNN